METFQISIPTWNILETTGYNPITTFWQDFSIADVYGQASIKDTFRRAFKVWKNYYKYLTELVMVLNHKIWEWYEKNNYERSRLYNDLYFEALNYGYDNLKDEELNYFVSTLD